MRKLALSHPNTIRAHNTDRVVVYPTIAVSYHTGRTLQALPPSSQTPRQLLYRAALSSPFLSLTKHRVTRTSFSMLRLNARLAKSMAISSISARPIPSRMQTMTLVAPKSEASSSLTPVQGLRLYSSSSTLLGRSHEVMQPTAKGLKTTWFMNLMQQGEAAALIHSYPLPPLHDTPPNTTLIL